MPNWCENTLTVTCSNKSKHKKELQKFKKLVANKGEIELTKKEVNAEYEKDMANKEIWRDNLELYIEYKKGTVKHYFEKYKQATFDKNGNTIIGKTEFSFQGIMPRPKSLDIASGSAVKNCVAIIKAEEENDFSELDKLISYGWYDNEGITTREGYIKKIKEEEIDKDTMATAKIYLDNVKKYGAGDWCDWSIENWGTKEDACDESLNDDNETELQYIFNTAWSPPIPVIKKASELFPNLNFEFTYEESGCDFAGEMEFERGECMRNEEGGYIEIMGSCSCCGRKLLQVGEVWTCPQCEKNVCAFCYSPYEDGTTECEECGYEIE